MVSNFDFLKEYWKDLAEIGSNAEGYVYSDPNASIIKVGMIAEKIVSYIFSYEQLTKPLEAIQSNLITILKREGLIPETIDNILYTIRRARNEAVHNNKGSVEQAKTVLRLGLNLCCWFMELYGDWQFEVPVYCEPVQDFGDANEIKLRLEEQEKKIEELLKNVELMQTKASRINVEEKSKQAKEIAENLELTTQENLLINKDAVRLEVNALPAISYALQQNGYEPINEIEITNKEQEIENITLSIKSNPGIFETYSREIEVLPSQQTISFRNIKLKIDVNYLISLTERQKTIVTVQLIDKDYKLITEELVDIDVLTFDQWTGVAIYPELLSSFVTPNHPQIAGIISKASEFLNKWTGNASFDGYQSDDKSRVLMQGAAIYTALQSLDIAYVETPASFGNIGQRVRLVDNVLNNKIGNCLDLTLLYTACLEAVGLNTILCLKPGHIFPGFWLARGSFPDVTNDDVSIVTKRMAEGIDDITVVEATAFTYGKNIKFDDARNLAFDEMTDRNPVDLVIDIKCARLMGIIPLPARIQTSGGYYIERSTQQTYEIKKPEAVRDYGYEFDSNQIYDKKLQWERKLLDLGLRNSLINLHLKRSIVPILTSSLDELEDALYDGDSFIIHPKPENWNNLKNDFAAISNLGSLYEFVSEEFKVGRIHSSLTESELNNALKNLYRNARSSFEENGANTLFMAVGLLKWCEPNKSSTRHYAPIVLLPVEIKKKSASQGFTISLRVDDEPQVNITIMEKLKQDFGLTIKGLDVLPEDEHGLDIRKILTIFRNAILHQSYWDVLESAYLGIFSFSQFVMWNDIHNRSKDLEKNKIVKSLIENHLTWNSKKITDTEALSTKDSYLTLPVDSSQLYAIKGAENGESFVLHGPPGTGKSQTITSMIADLLAKDKKVLFVAEKRAALEVVQRRITDLGLDQFCLELHSNKAKKKEVLAKIEKVFEATNRRPSGYEARIKQIEDIKKELDVYVQELHEQRACGSSLYEVLNKYEAYSQYDGLIEIPFNRIEQFTDINLDELTYLIDELVITAKTIGHPNTHPLKGIGATEYYQGIESEITDLVNEYLIRQTSFAEKTEDICHMLKMPLGLTYESYISAFNTVVGVNVLKDLPGNLIKLNDSENTFDWLEILCDEAIKLQEQKEELLENWNATFLSSNGQELFNEYSSILGSNAISRLFSTNKFIKKISIYSKGDVNKDNIRYDLQTLLDYQNGTNELKGSLDVYRSVFGNLYKFDNTDWYDVKNKLATAKKQIKMIDVQYGYNTRVAYADNIDIKDKIYALENEKTYFDLCRDKLISLVKPTIDNNIMWYKAERELLSRLLANIGLLKEWCSWNRMCVEIEANNLQAVVDVYYSGIPHDQIKGLYIKSFYKRLATLIIDECKSLNSFNGELFERKVEQFRLYDNQLRELTKKQVYYLVSSRITKYLKEHEQSPVLASLKRMIKSKGRGVSIRKIFENCSDVIQTLCPCILMSPLSAAQYLDPSTKKFDVIIFDEASQLQTCKAVGAIARAENAIIVGDEKQMPPTNFFMVNNIDEENAEYDDLESILEDALVINMPQCSLNWHYRSNHESLIAFSNSQFYDNKLYTFPSLNDRESKVRLVKVDGVFERGRKRINTAEAKAIVDEIKRRFEDPVMRKDSIGVVTFNIPQQNIIEDLLSAACAKNKELDKWVNNEEEPLFIKNLETVQGDERDVIMFSVTYGPDENQKVSMNFGPLNRDGGEKRLNVAVSRARKEMIVFSSLMPEQINTSRTRAEGVFALKNFLIFASNNRLTLTNEQTKSVNKEKMAVIKSITEALSRNGYNCDVLVGHSDFKIDICVIDPTDNEKYLLGILLDGDIYAQSKFTRDREISQIDILNGLGWNTIRIWSMDWWNNKNKQILRILDLLNTIKPKSAILAEKVVQIINKTVDTKKDEPKEVKPAVTVVEKPVKIEKKHIVLSASEIKKKVEEIVREEAPITNSRVNQRLFDYFEVGDDKEKKRLIVDIVDLMEFITTEEYDQIVYWNSESRETGYKQFRTSDELKRKVGDIPYIEIENAMLRVIKDNSGISQQDLVKLTAKKMKISLDKEAELCFNTVLSQSNRLKSKMVPRDDKKAEKKGESSKPIQLSSTNQFSKGQTNKLIDYFLLNNFEVITDANSNDIWVIYSEQKKDVLISIVKTFKCSCKISVNGSQLTKYRKAWRIMGYKGD